MADRVAGIDLGTTNSSCAVYKTNKVEILTFNDSKSRQASWFFKDGQTELYGNPAKDKGGTEPQFAMYDSKRLIAKTYDEISSEDIKKYINVENKDGKIIYRIKNEKNNFDETFTPEDIHERLLKFMEKELDIFNGGKITRAVICVPATFNVKQREATMKAALFHHRNTEEEIVYESVKLIKEPVASALAYLDTENVNVPNGSKILIYDFGGGTFDLALIEYNNGCMDVIATDGKDHLGGQDITNAIFKEFAKKYKIDLDSNEKAMKRKKAKLLKACEHTKKLFVDVTAESQPLEINDDDCEDISYAYFCKLSDPFIEQTLTTTKDFMKRNKVGVNDIFKVIGTGGSSLLRNVKTQLCKLFNKDDQVYISDTPFEDVAKGAALCGHKFMERTTIAPIGIRATRNKKKSFIEIIPIGTKWGDTITISGVNDNKAPDALFKFYEYDVSEENYLGKLILPFDEKDKNKKINSILVTLKVKINYKGELEAEASYEGGNERKAIIRLFKTVEDF